MHKWLRVVLLVLVLIAQPVWATVGFVPSAGIWFSRSEFYPRETIRVYTVVTNNEYYALDMIVALYDNSRLVEKVSVKNLLKDTAQLVTLFWAPGEGDHSLTVAITEATAKDERGTKQPLDLARINSVAGSPLTIKSQPVYPVVAAAITKNATQPNITSTTAPPIVAGSTVVTVKKEGDKLALTPSVQQAPYPAQPESASDTHTDPFVQNRAIIAQAQQVAQTLTSSAERISDTYQKTKTFVEKSKEWYQEGKEAAMRTGEQLKKAGPVWNTISDHNNPKQLAVIGATLLILCWLVRRALRRRRRFAD